jgi:hypothetical protein
MKSRVSRSALPSTTSSLRPCPFPLPSPCPCPSRVPWIPFPFLAHHYTYLCLHLEPYSSLFNITPSPSSLLPSSPTQSLFPSPYLYPTMSSLDSALVPSLPIGKRTYPPAIVLSFLSSLCNILYLLINMILLLVSLLLSSTPV